MISEKDKDAIISQIEMIWGSRPIFYLKFCEKEDYAEDVVAGLLYANDPEYYRKKEIETGIKGQGDKNEATLSLDITKLQAFDINTGELVFSNSGGTYHIRDKHDDNIPLVSFVGLPIRSLQLISASNGRIEFKLPFSEKEFDEMKDTFGNYCVIICAKELENKISERYAGLGVQYLFDQVKYVTNNYLEQIKSYQNSSLEHLMFKDEYFSYQREYRLAMGLEMPEDHYIRIAKLDKAKIYDSGRLSDLVLAFEAKA